MLVKVCGSAVFGVEVTTITIEINVDIGFDYHLVGLSDNAVKESSRRSSAALQNTRYKYLDKKIIVNIAPADLPEKGSAYDLTFALGILAGSKHIKAENLSDYIIMGELSLDGSLQPIKGALSIAIKAREEGFIGFILPRQSAREAAVVDNLEVYGVENILEVINFFDKDGPFGKTVINRREELYSNLNNPEHEFADVKGQESIGIAAAGGHKIFLVGPPGAGKTIPEKRLPDILPPMTLHQALETTKIHYVVGRVRENVRLIDEPPFRSPHHTFLNVALVGGRAYPQRGEISLSYNGVLFSGELPEFKKGVCEGMRQPFEVREVSISRAKVTVTYPSSFKLVASMDPCPRGYLNDPYSPVISNPAEMQRYLGKISGSLLKRFEIQIEVIPVPFEKLSDQRRGESSVEIRKSVTEACEIQKNRFKESPNVYYKPQKNVKQIREFCDPDETSKELLKTAMERLNHSTRAYDRILKVSRSIADPEGSESICGNHFSEAIQYRSLDRDGWIGKKNAKHLFRSL